MAFIPILEVMEEYRGKTVLLLKIESCLDKTVWFCTINIRVMQSPQFALGQDWQQCKEGPHDTLHLFYCPAKLTQLTEALLLCPSWCWTRLRWIRRDTAVETATTTTTCKCNNGKFKRYSVEAFLHRTWTDDDCTIHEPKSLVCLGSWRPAMDGGWTPRTTFIL